VRFERIVKGLSKRMAKMQAQMERVGKVARNMLLGAGAAMAGFTKLFANQEKAEKLLDAALRSTGQWVNALAPQLRKAAREMQTLTVYGDEFILGLMAQAVNLGATGKGIEEQTRQAIGLATALKMDLGTALRYTVLAQQGEFTMLRRYIPELRKTEDATEQLAIVQRMANAGWRQAQAEARTTAGRFAQLKNELSDLGEQLGAIFIPQTRATIKRIRELLTAASGWIKENADIVRSMTKVTAGMLGGLAILPKLTGAIMGLTKVMTFLASHPLVAVAIGLGALVAKFALAATEGMTFAERIRRAMQWMRKVVVTALAGVTFAFDNWLTGLKLFGVSAAYHLVKFANDVKYILTYTIPEYLKWLRHHWKATFKTLWQNTKTWAQNLDDNLQRLRTQLEHFWGYEWTFEWKPLTEGLENAFKDLPTIADRQIGRIEGRLAARMAALGKDMGRQWAEHLAEYMSKYGGAKLPGKPDTGAAGGGMFGALAGRLHGALMSTWRKTLAGFKLFWQKATALGKPLPTPTGLERAERRAAFVGAEELWERFQTKALESDVPREHLKVAKDQLKEDKASRDVLLAIRDKLDNLGGTVTVIP